MPKNAPKKRTPRIEPPEEPLPSADEQDPEGVLMVKVTAPLSIRLRTIARENKMSYSAVFRLGLEAGLPHVVAALSRLRAEGKEVGT
jgi:hypothetical protein